VAASNLTPGPFPSGKGSKIRRGELVFPKIQFPFPLGKRLLPTIRFPFPLGKGLGVRLFGSFATPAPSFFVSPDGLQN